MPFCAECPPVVKAIRRYDGLEFRLSKRAASKWFGSVSYTYSRLTGNYAGLTNTDPTDGTGGRHAPNNSRAFDIPTMTYLPNGKIDDGPLSTDRPHTAKAYGLLRLQVDRHGDRFRRNPVRLSRARRSAPACPWSALPRPASGLKAAAIS